MKKSNASEIKWVLFTICATFAILAICTWHSHQTHATDEVVTENLATIETVAATTEPEVEIMYLDFVFGEHPDATVMPSELANYELDWKKHPAKFKEWVCENGEYDDGFYYWYSPNSMTLYKYEFETGWIYRHDFDSTNRGEFKIVGSVFTPEISASSIYVPYSHGEYTRKQALREISFDNTANDPGVVHVRLWSIDEESGKSVCKEINNFETHEPVKLLDTSADPTELFFWVNSKKLVRVTEDEVETMINADLLLTDVEYPRLSHIILSNGNLLKSDSYRNHGEDSLYYIFSILKDDLYNSSHDDSEMWRKNVVDTDGNFYVTTDGKIGVVEFGFTFNEKVTSIEEACSLYEELSNEFDSLDAYERSEFAMRVSEEYGIPVEFAGKVKEWRTSTYARFSDVRYNAPKLISAE